VVAEGVEDAQSLADLTLWGCDLGQGYFIGRPMSAPMMVEWLRARSTELALEGAARA
jgi:EAL domain-containing protein (putative c-di-GMP-specific phosphodiesterase class I)